MVAEVELLDTAVRLCRAAKIAPPVDMERLTGGKNNRVFRVKLAEGNDVVAKVYHRDPRDPRDRLKAEWSFLTYAWHHGARAIPKPLASEPETSSALYSLAPGEKLATDDISPAHVKAAANFIISVNSAPRSFADHAAGSEACFSLEDHVATVDRRLARLDGIDPSGPNASEALGLVANEISPLWTRVRETALAGEDEQRRLLPEAEILSPSDFGFHNALADADGQLTFLDFEYAGRDDPAKLVSDFFCCPEVPVPLRYRSEFVAALSEGLPLDPAFPSRCDRLLDVYRFKWIAIIMNEFLPAGAARRAFADTGTHEARCAAQIGKARAKLAEIGSR